ncbi:Cof-type HAD-IIB family hydrolase [Eubacteriales bacterium OttesenSCG-928-M02]|nr:Cof-type HAD-IIB family hydrolase [Eubacteriales bacterium OttesenSCG-928-M02]
MAEIQLIVTDLDGSFLANRTDICEENIAVIAEAQRRGIKVCGCTARNWSTSKRIAERAGMKDLFVVCDGATTLDVTTGEVLERRNIDPQYIEPMTMLLLKYSDKVHYKGFLETIGTHEHINEWNRDVCMDDGTIYDPLASQHGYLVDTVEEMIALGKMHAQIAMALLDDTKNNQLYYDLCGIGDFEFSAAGRMGVQITAKNVTKGNAVEKLAKHYGIKQENVMAIGDNRNDRSMVMWAGIGVAVENGDESLKNVADYIAKPCYQAGFADAVEKFAL